MRVAAGRNTTRVRWPYWDLRHVHHGADWVQLPLFDPDDPEHVTPDPGDHITTQDLH